MVRGRKGDRALQDHDALPPPPWRNVYLHPTPRIDSTRASKGETGVLAGQPETSMAKRALN